MAKIPELAIVLLVLILALSISVPAWANREHKVHNIVLYPNKQSWCTTRNISQVITEPGCKQVTIDNNVCVGACFSYSIPHTEPSDPGEVIGPYCDSCQPSNVSYEFVKVDCTENANMKSPFLYKQVQLIHNCSCTACEEQSQHRNAPSGGQDHETDASQEQLHNHHHQKHQKQQHQEHSQHQAPAGAGGQEGHHHHQHHQGESDGNADSDMIQDDIPEILEVVHYSENDTEPIRHTPVHDFQSHDSGTTYLQQQQLNHYEHNSHTDNVKKLLHQKITKLLRSIEETNSPADREQLVEMIRLIKGTSDRNWDELVESLQSENSILDFTRLRSELVEEEPLGVPFTDRNVGPVDEVGEEDDDDQTAVAGDEQKHTIPHPFQPSDEDHQRLMQHQYDSIRHLQERAQDSHTEEHRGEGHSSGEAPAMTKQHHQHVVGERIDAHHHLERGPHGALVIRPNEGDQEVHRSRQNGHEITEKINIHAHELKPNHAGTVVTYNGGHAVSSEAPHEHSAEKSHHHAPPHQHGHHLHGSHHAHNGRNMHEHHPQGHPQHHQPHPDTSEGLPA